MRIKHTSFLASLSALSLLALLASLAVPKAAVLKEDKLWKVTEGLQ